MCSLMSKGGAGESLLASSDKGQFTVTPTTPTVCTHENRWDKTAVLADETERPRHDGIQLRVGNTEVVIGAAGSNF